MSCKEWLPALLQAADDDWTASDPAERGRLAEHLDRCAACRRALAEQRVVRQALAARTDAMVPAGFAARVLADVRVVPHWMELLHWRTWTYRLAPVAAALLLMAGLAVRSAADPTPADAGNVAGLVDAWTFGASENGALPAYALLGEDDVNGDLLLETILSTAPDETLELGDQS
ncbi:MAG: hypothetical protein OXF27_09260 [Acidobacteria bacterium]|nr:hypothetical protein [Acidobacteriota bacterium]